MPEQWTMMSRRSGTQHSSTPIGWVLAGLLCGVVAGVVLLDRVDMSKPSPVSSAPTYTFVEGPVTIPQETYVLSREEAERRTAELSGCVDAYLATLPAMTEAQQADETVFQAEALRRMQDAYRACGVVVRPAP